MKKNNLSQKAHRREFLGTLVTGAATIGLAGITSPFTVKANENTPEFFGEEDAWFNKITGKHRMVFDVTRPHEMLPFAWPKVFLLTNEKTGTSVKETSAVVVLRHEGIPYAMQNSLWAKYKFGEVFKIDDATTKAPAMRNAFWQPKPGDFQLPGLGNVAIGINELQQDGVLFCVCDMALTVYSAALAGNMNMKAEDVKKEWIAGVLPGIQVVPSGVWAIGRAQEHGCAYCFTG